VLRRFAINCALAATIALPAAARTRPHYGGTLHVEIENDPRQSPDGLTKRLVFDGLTALGADGMVRSALAVSWESDDNDHRWQFRLRPNVHFHDGSPLTSTAVVASLNLTCNSSCPWTTVHAVGPFVIFTGDSPMPNLPDLLASDEFLISLVATPDGKAPSGAIGTGPFQLTSFNGGVMVLAANENCWSGRPFLDGIEIRVHRPVRDQWLDLGVGRADVVEVPAEQLHQAQQQRLTVIVSPPVMQLALVVSDTGALSNPMMRRAIALAVDRSSLFNVIFQKQGEVTASLLPQSISGYAFLFPTDRDLNRAHELRGGLTAPALTLSVEDGPTMQLAAQRIAINLREAGFNVQVAPAGSGQRADLALRKLPIEGADPAAAMVLLVRSTGQVSPIVQQAPDSLFRAESEFLDRKTLIPLLDLPRAYAVSGRVRDVELRADGTLDLAGVSLENAP
jgi:peptide/nickel transport system substrate-binding protein